MKKRDTLDPHTHGSQQPARATGTQLHFGQLNAQAVLRTLPTARSKSELMGTQKMSWYLVGKDRHSTVCKLIPHTQPQEWKPGLDRRKNLYSFRQETGEKTKLSKNCAKMTGPWTWTKFVVWRHRTLRFFPHIRMQWKFLILGQGKWMPQRPKGTGKTQWAQ